MAGDISRESYRSALAERIGREAADALEGSTVGIAGLGGLGSNIALLLARSGVGKLVIADFDTVELSNIHRQGYPLSSVGMKKTDAVAKEIERINPWCTVEKHDIRLDRDNVSVFGGCDVVCEALDDARQKIMLIESLSSMGKRIVSGNGMAGMGDANSIVTRKAGSSLYICGDGSSDVKDTGSLSASRVAVCAAHQANATIRLLLGMEP